MGDIADGSNIDLNYGISPVLIRNPLIFTVGVFSSGRKETDLPSPHNA